MSRELIIKFYQKLEVDLETQTFDHDPTIRREAKDPGNNYFILLGFEEDEQMDIIITHSYQRATEVFEKSVRYRHLLTNGNVDFLSKIQHDIPAAKIALQNADRIRAHRDNLYRMRRKALESHGKSWRTSGKTIDVYLTEWAARLGFLKGDIPKVVAEVKPFCPPEPAPIISNGGSATCVQGEKFVFTIGATNHPTDYNATGLPLGLTIDRRMGVISGIPTTATTRPASITLLATNSTGGGSSVLSLTINPPPPPPLPVVYVTVDFAGAGKGTVEQFVLGKAVVHQPPKVRLQIVAKSTLKIRAIPGISSTFASWQDVPNNLGQDPDLSFSVDSNCAIKVVFLPYVNEWSYGAIILTIVAAFAEYVSIIDSQLLSPAGITWREWFPEASIGVCVIGTMVAGMGIKQGGLHGGIGKTLAICALITNLIIGGIGFTKLLEKPSPRQSGVNRFVPVADLRTDQRRQKRGCRPTTGHNRVSVISPS